MSTKKLGYYRAHMQDNYASFISELENHINNLKEYIRYIEKARIKFASTNEANAVINRLIAPYNEDIEWFTGKMEWLISKADYWAEKRYGHAKEFDKEYCTFLEEVRPRLDAGVDDLYENRMYGNVLEAYVRGLNDGVLETKK